MANNDGLLLDYILGHVDESNPELSELLTDPDIDQQLKALNNCMTALTDPLPAREPSDDLRGAILSSISHQGPGRFAGLRDRLARFFNIEITQSRRMLDSIGQLELPIWEPTYREGVWLQHLDCEGALSGADCGLVHLSAGAVVDPHEHLGDEWMLILEGFVTTDCGKRLATGDHLHSPAGSSHAFEVDPEHACTFAVIVNEGIRWISDQGPAH